MGRKKIVLSQSEIDERKERYWGPARNSARREKYAKDAAYRQTVQQQVKESYRKARIEQGLEVRDQDCRENIGALGSIGTVREVRMADGTTTPLLTFTTEEVAVAFERNQQVIYRWQSAGLFPRPGMLAKTEFSDKQPVYSADEIRAMMEIFGAHQETSQYYRKFHTDVAESMFGVANAHRRGFVANGVVAEPAA